MGLLWFRNKYPTIASKIGAHYISNFILSIAFSNKGIGILCLLLACWLLLLVHLWSFYWGWLLSLCCWFFLLGVCKLLIYNSQGEICEHYFDVVVDHLAHWLIFLFFLTFQHVPVAQWALPSRMMRMDYDLQLVPWTFPLMLFLKGSGLIIFSYISAIFSLASSTNVESSLHLFGLSQTMLVVMFRAMILLVT